MSLESWEELQQLWRTDAETDNQLQVALQEDAENLHRTVKWSIVRSYGFSLLSLLGMGYVIWELTDALTIPHLTPLLVGLIMAGYAGLAIWKVYLRLSYARGLSLTVSDHLDFMARRATSRQRLATATMMTMGFSALVVLGLVLNELHYQTPEALLTPDRLLGLGGLYAILSAITAFAFWRHRVARRDVRNLTMITRQETTPE